MDPIIQQILEHVAKINDELGGVQKEMGNIKADVAVLKAQINEIIWLLRALGSAVLLWFITRLGSVTRFFKNLNLNNSSQV